MKTMKKTIKMVALLIALCMVFTVVLAACDKGCGEGNHVDADHDGKCDVCGQSGLPVTHTGGQATCQSKAKCEVCGAEYGDTGYHVDGNKDKKCDVCSLALTYTYNSYTTLVPTYWNPLDYKDSDASSMISMGASSFYEFDYAFDDNGEIINGQFSIVPVMASGDPIDVTSQYVGEAWHIKEGDIARAWKIPLRTDLCWDDGTPITPSSFVYSFNALLDPMFLNLRADSYYKGNTAIVNARNYYFQGQSVWQDNAGDYDYEDLVGSGESYKLGGNDVLIVLNEGLDWLGGYSLHTYVSAYGSSYFDVEAYKQLLALADDKGRVKVTDESVALLAQVISAVEAWGETEEDVVNYMYYYYTYGKMDWDNVGLKAIETDTENAIVIIFENEFSADGALYNWAYSMGSFPLVKEDIYEKCKVAPSGDSKKWTSTYCTSVETSPSYGPYKLTSWQLGKQYVFSKNTNWWGYQMSQYENQYQTDTVVYDLIEDWNTAWMEFQKGNLAGVGIDVSIADDYKTSSQAYFTPSDFIQSIQIQSSATDRLVNADDGLANELLLNQKFRKAISLGFDRAEYTRTCTTSSLPGYGLFCSIHYYDVVNGKVFREEDVAKRVICEVYGVDVNDYPSLDDAYEAVTGYNLELARKLVKEAIAEEIEKGTIKATDLKISWTVGSSVDTETARRPYNFLKDALNAILVGSSLEGGLTLEYDGTHNSTNDAFAEDFIAGQYEFVFAGWNGSAWNPYNLLGAYLEDDYRYAVGWDPESVVVEITLKDYDFGEGSHTASMNLMDWFNCVNGNSGAKYNLSEGFATTEDRLTIAAALEKEILETYFCVPVAYSFSASLRSYKIKAISNDYNTFMGWGGIQYYTYNYDDASWAMFVQRNGGTLDYKK